MCLAFNEEIFGIVFIRFVNKKSNVNKIFISLLEISLENEIFIRINVSYLSC